MTDTITYRLMNSNGSEEDGVTTTTNPARTLVSNALSDRFRHADWYANLLDKAGALDGLTSAGEAQEILGEHMMMVEAESVVRCIKDRTSLFQLM